MKRRLIAVLLAAALAAGSSMSVWAAEEPGSTVENETEEAAGEEINVLENYEEPEAGAEEEAVIAENLETEAEEAENVEEPAELAENAEEVATAETISQTDENGLKWELTDGVLTISGTGKMGKSDSFLTSDRRKEVTSVVIKEGVTEIGVGAFAGCSALMSVSIPESVTEIGIGSFFNCSALTSISIPESVTDIKYDTFSGCSSLTSVSIPEGVVRIGCNAFSDCISLSHIFIPEGVTGIGAGAFENCKNLKKVTIPESVKSIGYLAFSECTGLRSVTFKGDVPEIHDSINPASVKEEEQPFEGVTAVAYYPTGNQTYTDEIKASYGEGLTWKENTAAAISFTDVKETDWYYEAAGYVFTKGIMTGMNDTEFGPGVRLSRSQFATILYRMEGEPKEEYDETAFPDVADNMFYTLPAMWAKKTGVIKGYDDGRFGPADENTREQMAVMMYRYAEMLGLDISASGDLSGFPDADKVSGFAEKEMKWAVGKGLIKGDGGRINPQGTAERAQCATIIMRFMEAYGL